MSTPSFIVVEGPIGVGKTSLVTRLAASLQAESLLEDPDENPFLKRFYSHGAAAAFPTQLFFLFQRSQQFDGLRQRDLFRGPLVSDFMLEKDRLFARLNLDDDEMDLYDKVYQRVSLEAPSPDLVVYLRAPVEVLMQRIRQRGRQVERSIDPGYLYRLCGAYDEFFGRYEGSPLLIVDASEINPVASQRDYQLLLDKICSVRAGRHFFNPGPSLL